MWSLSSPIVSNPDHQWSLGIILQAVTKSHLIISKDDMRNKDYHIFDTDTYTCNYSHRKFAEFILKFETVNNESFVSVAGCVFFRS